MDNGLNVKESKATNQHPRNKARFLKSYYRAKIHGQTGKLTRAKWLSELTRKLAIFRKIDESKFTDNELVNFTIYCYFIGYVDKLTLNAVSYTKLDTIEQFINADLEHIVNNSSDLYEMKWSTIAKLEEFRSESSKIYRDYSKRFSIPTDSQSDGQNGTNQIRHEALQI